MALCNDDETAPPSSRDDREAEEAYRRRLSEVTGADARIVLAREPEARTRVRRFAGMCGPWEQYGRQILLLFELLRDWREGRQPMPWRSVAAVTAALLYFINPFDMMPDLLPAVGYLDDFVVIGACMRLIQSDLRAYMKSRRLPPEEYGL